jgi:glycosyltransferase involved in cell wall biosynthesis
VYLEVFLVPPASPRVGLNLLYVRPGEIGGGETYARELVAALARVARDVQLVLFLNRVAYDSFAGIADDERVHRVLCGTPVSPHIRPCWEQVSLPALCGRQRIDLLHSLGYVVPLLARCPQVVTIHDMIYRVAPTMISRARRLYWTVMLPPSARLARAVITGSEHSRRDIVEYLRLPRDKVCVTPYGAGQLLPDAAPWDHVKAKHGVQEPFFLAVGGAEHKRIDVMERAIQIAADRDGLAATLVITGPGLPPATRNGRVRQIGFVPAADLAALYSRALALVCCSEMEGFGLPLLEAFRMGTPVIASARTALPEVAGSAGLMTAYGDAGAVADAMTRVATSEGLRAELRSRGLMQAQRYSWERCAGATLEVYRNVLASAA